MTEALVGKKVKSVSIGERKDVLRFDFEGFGALPLFVSATGDCCSNSWFEHITGIDALVGGTVARVVGRDMPEDSWNVPDQDVLTRYYGWTVETEKGRLDIEMRNESNGYYGGDIDLGHGGPSPSPMLPVSEDF